MRRALAIAAVCIAAPAAADTITVKVTEVAGGVAYVTPGRAAGLVPGTKVRMRGTALVVTESTEKTAALRVDGGGIAVGDTGSATVDVAVATAARTLPKPRAQTEFTGQWPDAVRPAETQQPDAVPLGAGRAPGRAHVTMIAHGYGTATKDSVEGDGLSGTANESVRREIEIAGQTN